VTDLVLTLIGPDRPGLVEALAERVAAHGGNWLESRMARLAGQFAGILRVEVPDPQAAKLRAALEQLSERGLRVVVEAPLPAAQGQRPLVLDLMGIDRPGLVREIARLLAERNVNIEELQTDRSPAPMSGELMFRSRARIQLPAGTDAAELRSRIERLASDLSVEITLATPES
jgi:glycine cleavage system regulatory protein